MEKLDLGGDDVAVHYLALLLSKPKATKKTKKLRKSDKLITQNFQIVHSYYFKHNFISWEKSFLKHTAKTQSSAHPQLTFSSYTGRKQKQ